MHIKNFIYLFAFNICLLFSGNAVHAAEDFPAWLSDFRQEALQKGISTRTIRSTLYNIESIPRVIELDRKQPEGKMTFARYRERIVHPLRIKTGRKMLKENTTALAKIENQYGIAPQYVVALWGIETNYGANTGGFNIIPALATLAWDGRRGEFFKKELLAALKILDQGHIAPEKMKGSWAGAMGQNQFMPSSFMGLAVDGNGDGRKDIWTTKADVFASTANYLVKNGWNAGQRWGREVHLSQNIPESLTGLKIKKDLSTWKSMGITQPGGQAIPVESGMKASLVTPDGLGGPAFLIYDNYRTIMKWNHSTYFATSVGLLADAIAD